METLSDVLMRYAEEDLVPRYLREQCPQFREAEEQTDCLLQQLKEMGPEAEACAKRLAFELDTLSICLKQVFLLSGISIGLELERLSVFGRGYGT